MKQKKTFCKRLLTMLLSLAMVFTSINMPGNTIVVKAAENAYEGTDTCGATYNADTKQVTFFIKSTDAAYEGLNNFFYKEYNSYEEAAAAHT